MNIVKKIIYKVLKKDICICIPSLYLFILQFSKTLTKLFKIYPNCAYITLFRKKGFMLEEMF